jgi:hypothetical protein
MNADYFEAVLEEQFLTSASMDSLCLASLAETIEKICDKQLQSKNISFNKTKNISLITVFERELSTELTIISNSVVFCIHNNPPQPPTK